MALTIVQRKLDPNNDAPKQVPGNTFWSYTSITLDGSYAAGGIPLTPQQLGMTDAVYAGICGVRTSVATASPSDGVLDCSNPAAPKLKLQGATSLAELANGAGSGAIVDILAIGY